MLRLNVCDTKHLYRMQPGYNVFGVRWNTTDILNLPSPHEWSIGCVHKMTSSNGNIFRVTGLSCGEFTGHRWVPCTKASDAELWFFFLAATKQLYKWYFPSVRLSVCPSVCPSHLFDYVPIIGSSWNFQELLPMTNVRSAKGQGQRSKVKVTDVTTQLQPFPDCNSSLNSHMMMKWCI